MRSALVLVALVAGVASCSKQPPPKPPQPMGVTPEGGGKTFGGQGVHTVHGSYPVAAAGPRTLGPHLVRLGETAGIVAHLSTADDRTRRMVVVPLDGHGEPVADARTVAQVPASTSTFLVRSTGGGAPNAVAAWVALTERGLAVWLTGIGADGGLLFNPVELARTNDNIVWLDVVPTARGALCVWAEETRADTVTLLAAPLGIDGRPRGVPTRLVRNVRSWQLVREGDTAAIAYLRDGSGAADLVLQRLDSEGHTKGEGIVVASQLKRATGLEAVGLVGAHAGATLVGWTDRAGIEPQARLTLVAKDGSLTSAMPFEPAGASALTAIVAGPAGTVVAWEQPWADRQDTAIRLARIDLEHGLRAAAGPRIPYGGGRPELVAIADGFALSGIFAQCVPDGDTCVPERTPSFLRLDANLGFAQIERVQTDERQAEPALQGWDLQCESRDCQLLFATDGSPTPVHSANFPKRPSPARLAVAAPAAVGPGVLSVRTLARGPGYHDVAAVPSGKGTLVALLSEPESDESRRASPRSRREAPASAPPTCRVSVLSLDAGGAPAGEPLVVTTRAFPDGGVALAPLDGGGAVLAWVALENGDPRVHVALVDANGKRGNVVTLATAKGSAASVALVPVDDGFVAGWVDGRDGNGEVYAVHLTKDLRRGTEERITNAPGDASDVTLLAHKGIVWVAWSDIRDGGNEGFADIYVARLSSKQAKRMGDEVRVQATAAHSRSPSLAAAGDSVVLGWIEEGPTSVDATSSGSYGAMLAWLDNRGRPVESPQRFGGASAGAPSTLVLASSGAGARALLARSAPGALVLDAATIGAEPGPPKFSPIFTLDGPPTLDAPMALVGDAAVFTDVGQAPGERRARRLAVDWSR